MSETLVHPGLLPAEQRSFALYSRFLNPSGLSAGLLEWFTNGLEFFYDQTRNSPIWIPLKCRLVDDELEIFQIAFHPAICEIKRFKRSHYWFEAKLPNDWATKLIVDPSGVINSINLDDTHNQILLARYYQPYFGLKDQATNLHKELYLQGQLLDFLGTEISEEEDYPKNT